MLYILSNEWFLPVYYPLKGNFKSCIVKENTNKKEKKSRESEFILASFRVQMTQ
jgi:hypothetical protein